MQKQNKQYDPLLLSAKFGDGCYVTQSTGERFGYKSYYLQFTCYSRLYVNYKVRHLKSLGIYVNAPRRQSSGYSDNFGYGFCTRINPLISEVGGMDRIEALSHFTKEAMILYYLDDGSYHQKKHFGHLYCNMFSDEEVELLISKFYELYPIKKCSKRMDRKRDGREFPYLYIPVSTMDKFKVDVRSFIYQNKIWSMLYKTGGDNHGGNE